jgi:hypothetical protein
MSNLDWFRHRKRTQAPNNRFQELFRHKLNVRQIRIYEVEVSHGSVRFRGTTVCNWGHLRPVFSFRLNL